MFLLKAIIQIKITLRNISPQANPAPLPNACDSPTQQRIFITNAAIIATIIKISANISMPMYAPMRFPAYP